MSTFVADVHRAKRGGGTARATAESSVESGRRPSGANQPTGLGRSTERRTAGNEAADRNSGPLMNG